MTKDEKYISRCLQLAYNGLCNTAPNPMVGAVIVYHDHHYWRRLPHPLRTRHMPK